MPRGRPRGPTNKSLFKSSVNYLSAKSVVGSQRHHTYNHERYSTYNKYWFRWKGLLLSILWFKWGFINFIDYTTLQTERHWREYIKFSCSEYKRVWTITTLSDTLFRTSLHHFCPTLCLLTPIENHRVCFRNISCHHRFHPPCLQWTPGCFKALITPC